MRIVKMVKPWHVHAIIGILSTFLALIMLGMGQLGKTVFGLCASKSTNEFPYFGASKLVVQIFISFSTVTYLNSKLPRIPKYQELLRFY